MTTTIPALFLLLCSHLMSQRILCSEEITFIESGSFVEVDVYSSGLITASEVARSGLSFEFSFMTESVTAILLYAAASDSDPLQQQQQLSPTQADVVASSSSSGTGSLQQNQLFIAAEVINGKTVLSMNDGSGVVTLASEVIVNDGVWHRVNAIFSSSHMEVNVDGKSKFLRPSTSAAVAAAATGNPGIPGSGSAKMPKTLFDQINFASVFIGGMHIDREYNALQQNIHSLLTSGSAVESSLVGCVRELKVNRKVISIKSSSGTSSSPKCGWKFMCILSDPCIEEAECYQEGLDGFHCVCDQPPCQRPSQPRTAGGISSADQDHGPEINVAEERVSDKEREVSKRVQAAGSAAGQSRDSVLQPNYRQRNHHRTGSSMSAAPAAAGSFFPSFPSSSSSSSSSPAPPSTLTTASLSPTPSPSLTKGLSLASAAEGDAAASTAGGKGSPFPVNHLSGGWKQDVPSDTSSSTAAAGSQPEPNLIQLRQQQSSSSRGATSVPPQQQQPPPASFVSYLGTVISKEQAITCFILAVVSLIAIVLVAMVRGFYLYGRRKENRRQTHKDLNLLSNSGCSNSSSTSSGCRKDSDTTTSACTPLPLGSDFDDPCELLSPPSDLLSPPSLSSRLTADFPEQPVAPMAAPPVHNYSTFGRSINRRDSSLFLPLPPPSFYFTNNATSFTDFSDLPSSPFRFSEYRD